jgi:cell division protease FtsH
MKDYSEETAHSIDLEIQGIIDQCYKKAQEVITANKAKLEEVSKVLMEKEMMDGDELKAILAEKK